MKQFFYKNQRLRERLTKTEEQVVETTQLLNVTTLQQMSEKEKKEKNEKMINVDEKSTKNVKMKKIVEKKFSKKKENLDTMMFGIVDVKNPNVKIFIKHYINDTTTISNSFTKFSFEFKNFLKKEGATQT